MFKYSLPPPPPPPQYRSSQDWRKNGGIGKRRLRESYITTKKHIGDLKISCGIRVGVNGGAVSWGGGARAGPVYTDNVRLSETPIIGVLELNPQGARLDIKARNFWRRGQDAFFDVCVTHVNAPSQKKQETKVTFHRHEERKKRNYMERCLYVEHATFTPLIIAL